MKQFRSAIGLLALVLFPSFLAAQQLEIHYINVGWGSSVLVKGPNGTTVLLEAGNTGKGSVTIRATRARRRCSRWHRCASTAAVST